MDRCVVRKPIKEAGTNNIMGYEIKFQAGSGDLYERGDYSSADAMISFLTQNSDKIFCDKPTFLTFTPSLLFRNLPRMIEKDKLVIQIEDNLIVHPLALPIIKKYRADGYKFAINDFQFSPKYMGMLEYMDYVRVNIGGTSGKERESLNHVVEVAKAFGKICVATGVDSKDDFVLANELHIPFMEGNYIAETMVSKASKMDYVQGNFFQLVVAVSKEEPEVYELEEIISRDAGLTYALLRLVNSAYFAQRKRTASVRQAMVTLGITQLREWIYMLGLQMDERDDSAEELLKMSFLRAKFAQELVEKMHRPDFVLNKSEAYMMGMFSGLEYMVDAPMEEILREIPVKDAVKDALISHAGEAGKLMDLILSYEQGDWKENRKLADELGIPTNILAQIYMDCIEDVNRIWSALMTDYGRAADAES